MSGPDPSGERIGFYHGSLLATRDLADDVAYESRLRGLHLRAVHRTWGAAGGLVPRLTADRRGVLVSPGVAYDTLGREIVLASAARLAGPPPSGNTVRSVDLVIRADDGAGRARLGWVAADPNPPGQARPAGPVARVGIDVPLGRFVLDPGGTLAGPTSAGRRGARGLGRPKTAFGLTRPGELRWEGPAGGRFTAVSTGIPGLVTTVSTAAAGFGDTPTYVVLLAHNPWTQLTIEAVAGRRERGVLPFVSVEETGSAMFRLRLLFGMRERDETLLDKALLKTLLKEARASAAQATFFWIGVESTVTDASIRHRSSGGFDD